MPPAQLLRLPLAYRLFFLYLEPISALVGAYYAHFRQQRYLQLLLHTATAPAQLVAVPLGTSVAMSQLASMYLFFAINEALVLRATRDLRVWRTVLLVLLIADLGHLNSLKELGPKVYYDITGWNAADVGNVPWVYAGAGMRLCFLAGVGLCGRPTRPT
ncbi:hypothetical protein TgHK011_002113 [Trichoderma gracile]|nr:hypothetical protein TgHK011_002113 [Trichoderma gracile]